MVELSPVGIQAARAKLNAPKTPFNPWRLLGASALAAAAAVGLAGAVVLGPGWEAPQPKAEPAAAEAQPVSLTLQSIEGGA